MIMSYCEQTMEQLQFLLLAQNYHIIALPTAAHSFLFALHLLSVHAEREPALVRNRALSYMAVARCPSVPLFYVSMYYSCGTERDKAHLSKRYIAKSYPSFLPFHSTHIPFLSPHEYSTWLAGAEEMGQITSCTQLSTRKQFYLHKQSAMSISKNCPFGRRKVERHWWRPLKSCERPQPVQIL